MYRPTCIALILTALVASGCDDDTGPGPTNPETPTEVSETFGGTLTVNGAATHPFSVTRAGNVTAQILSTSVEGATVGLSLGTWNGQACALIITNDNATVASTQTFPVTGTASSTGAFCVRIYDVGRLTGPVDYELRVTHF